MAFCAWDTKQHFGIVLGGRFQQGNHQLKALKCQGHGTKLTAERTRA